MRSARIAVAKGHAILLVTWVVGCGPSDAMLGDGRDWPMYRGDLAGTGYSPLAQITPQNVSSLARVWSYSLRYDAPGPDAPAGSPPPRGPNSQATPIVVGGVMYLPAVDRVVAIDPVSGEEIWRHTPWPKGHPLAEGWPTGRATTNKGPGYSSLPGRN